MFCHQPLPLTFHPTISMRAFHGLECLREVFGMTPERELFTVYSILVDGAVTNPSSKPSLVSSTTFIRLISAALPDSRDACPSYA